MVAMRPGTALAHAYVREAMSPVSSTNIRDDELIKMAAFKLAETARCVAMLAKEAETPGLRRLLTASAVAIGQQASELRAGTGALEHERPKLRREPVIADVGVSEQSLTPAAARGPRLAARG